MPKAITNSYQSRRWHIVIHNHQLHGLSDSDTVIAILMMFCPVYFCMCTEITSEGTPHLHIYLVTRSPVRFSTLKNRFETGHFEPAKGSSVDNRNYLLKEGVYAGSPKADTKVEGSFFEWGTIPRDERTEKQPAMQELIEDIQNGLSTPEIINKSPQHAMRIRQIEELRQMYLSDYYATQSRDVTVTYLWGATGTGKTTEVYRQHNAKDICRIINYQSNALFDPYHSEKILFFDEYRSQIPISSLLVYLDRFPITSLPARYYSRTACWDTVYFASNIPLTEQYKDTQIYQQETWKALLRRITRTVEMRADGSKIEQIYKNGGFINELPQ